MQFSLIILFAIVSFVQFIHKFQPLGDKYIEEKERATSKRQNRISEW